jgi:hypothetical protein
MIICPSHIAHNAGKYPSAVESLRIWWIDSVARIRIQHVLRAFFLKIVKSCFGAQALLDSVQNQKTALICLAIQLLFSILAAENGFQIRLFEAPLPRRGFYLRHSS